MSWLTWGILQFEYLQVHHRFPAPFLRLLASHESSFLPPPSQLEPQRLVSADQRWYRIVHLKDDVWTREDQQEKQTSGENPIIRFRDFFLFYCHPSLEKYGKVLYGTCACRSHNCNSQNCFLAPFSQLPCASFFGALRKPFAGAYFPTSSPVWRSPYRTMDAGCCFPEFDFQGQIEDQMLRSWPFFSSEIQLFFLIFQTPK